jgi:hypothetical protein
MSPDVVATARITTRTATRLLGGATKWAIRLLAEQIDFNIKTLARTIESSSGTTYFPFNINIAPP